MRLDPFECECEGCDESARYETTFTDMTKADICETCLDYLTEKGMVLMSVRFKSLA